MNQIHLLLETFKHTKFFSHPLGSDPVYTPFQYSAYVPQAKNNQCQGINQLIYEVYLFFLA